MIVMCSSPLLVPEFRTDASERKSFTVGRNTSKEGDISRGLVEEAQKNGAIAVRSGARLSSRPCDTLGY